MFCKEQTSKQDEGLFDATELDINPQMSLTDVLSSKVVLWNLECDYGLLDELLISGCLTEDMIEEICGSCFRYERNKKLITYINQSNLEKFLMGLRSVQQEHVSTYIVRNGERGSVCEDWPIHDTMVKAIYSISDKFVHEVSKELHDDVFSQGCISELHRRSIDIKSTREEMNMQLLTIIARRSESHLTKFLKCLEKDHKHLISQLNEIKASPSWLHIEGLSVCNNELFVVLQRQSKVNVYDTHSLTSSRDINIPDMGVPQGLAGCAHNKALYISDSQLKCIHRVDLTNNSVTRWAVKEYYMPLGLSVTAEHNLLVTVCLRMGESRVVEYTSEGQQVREIRLDRSIKYAHQTVQLSSNQFIVCHGTPLGDSTLQRVCQINAEGQILKSYGREKGGSEGQLSAPQSLTIDNNSKRVFVADWGNHRILMFDSDLTYLRHVHTSRDLKDPYRLYFDSSTDRLFVGEGSGRLIVISPTV